MRLSCYDSFVQHSAMTRSPVPPPALPVSQPMPANELAELENLQPARQQRLTLLEAVNAASPAFAELTKDSTNEYLKTKYLALPGLLQAIKPTLLEFGLAVWSQGICIDPEHNVWAVRTTLSLVDGTEEISSDFPLVCLGKDGDNHQRVGAMFTYGTRYNLFALLAICPDKDDEGSSHVVNTTAQPVTGLPGLAQNWPAQGQQTQAPQVMYQAQQPMPMQFAPQQQMQPAMQAMPVMANPVQPLPVLQ